MSIRNITHIRALLAAWALMAILGATSASPAPAMECWKFNQPDQPASGKLSIGQFKDAADRPESAYIVTLDKPACLSADEEEYRVAHAETLQIYSDLDDVLDKIESLVGKHVAVKGEPFGAHTAHHHAPIIMLISEIVEK